MSVAGDIIIELKLEDKDVSVNVRKAGAVLSQFQSTLNQTATSVKRLEDANSSMSTKFRHLVMTLGNLRFVAMDINDIFLRLPLAILKSAGELERMQVLMKGLSKELTEAGKSAEGIRDFKFVTGLAKNAPFEISALSDAFVKLKTAGIDPTNGSMSALVDSVARFGGTGEQLKRASVAIQQMTGKGVVSMEELRQQLGEAVPTAMKDMADGMGVSMEELAKIVQTGTLKAGPAIAKMLLMMRVNNEGAAAEMMKTWSGMLARLKSEWELTALFIAENGFGDASKDAVAQLTDMLKSDEFRRFASESGQALGDVMSTVLDVAKAMIKYREEIVMLAQAWIAYKVVFSGIVPISKAIDDSFRAKAALMMNMRANILQDASLNKAAALAELADIHRIRTERAASLAAQLASDRAELASVTARNAAIVAEHTRMTALMAATKGGVQIPGAQGFQTRAAGEFYLREQARSASALTAIQNTLTRSIDETSAAMRANAIAGAAKIASLEKVASASALARAGTMAATAATTALTGAMNLLGGPVGVAILAITGLVYWWQKVSAAADEALDRQRRAANFTSNTKDMEAAKKAQKDAEEALADAEKNMRVNKTLSFGSVKGSDIEAIGRLGAEVAKAKTQVVNIQKSLDASGAKELASSITDATSRKVQAVKEASALERASLEQKKREVLATMTAGTKEYTKKEKELNDERLNALNRGIAEQVSVLSKAEDAALASAKASTGADRSAQIQAVERLKAEREQLQKELSGNTIAVGTKSEYKPKAEKKPGGAKSDPVVTKVQAFIDDLNEESAKMDATMRGLLSNIGKVDSVAVALAEAEAKLAGGDFKQKGKGGREINATAAQAAEIRSKMAANALQADLVADMKKISSEINAMEPDYVHAMKVLEDPLGATEAPKTNRYKEIIARLKSQTGDMSEMVSRMEEGWRKAATIDLGSNVRELAEENRRMGFEIITDDALRVRLQIESDNQLHAVRTANRIKEAQDAKVGPAEIEKMQIQMDKNAVLRAEKLRLETRTPMQKMVDDWADSTKSMQQSTAQWSQQGVDAFVNFARTGKLEFGSLVQDVLAGILKIQVQKMIANTVGKGIDEITGGSSGGGDMFGSLAKMAASFFAFADGGIMSSQGSVPLRKYAAGGVANSPQLALYGEGSMNEAFVPLPDGRSIPVTMTGAFGGGGGAPTNVVVNVINQTSQQVGARQNTPKFDGKQMVLDVVLTAASSPGPFRDGMKGALGQ